MSQPHLIGTIKNQNGNMPSFAVTVTTNTTPAIIITMSGNTTYGQFKNSLGQFVYDINEVYLFSVNQSQISNVFKYSKYDSSGNQNLLSVIPVIDPFQYQPSLYVDTSEKDIVIDGRDFVRFSMLPNTSLAMKLFAERITNQDELNLFDLNNFKSLEEASGNFYFFEQYKDLV